MKRLTFIFVIIFTLVLNESFGQTFGVKAGINFSNLLYKENKGDDYNAYNKKVGLNFGASMEILLTNHLLFETGLLINNRGYKTSYAYDYAEFSVKVCPYYLDIPIRLKYQFGSKSLKPFVTAGSYFAYGISGKTITKTTENETTTESTETISWGSHFKRYDAGLDFGIGVEFKNFTLSANASQGLVNISNSSGSSSINKNELYSISLGYKFIK